MRTRNEAVQQTDEGTAGEMVLQCQEVWGGNLRVNRRVRLPGLSAWVYSQPCDYASVGGDVYYLSSCAGGQIVRLLVADVAGHGPAAADTSEALRGLPIGQHVSVFPTTMRCLS
jgi:hypothetical protein